jgi:hypothetical protein
VEPLGPPLSRGSSELRFSADGAACRHRLYVTKAWIVRWILHWILALSQVLIIAVLDVRISQKEQTDIRSDSSANNDFLPTWTSAFKMAGYPRVTISVSVVCHVARLHPCSMDQPRTPPKRDRTNENFHKATSRLMRRGHQISRRYQAHVYIQVSRQRKYYDYTSTTDTSFPLPGEALVGFLILQDLPG